MATPDSSYDVVILGSGIAGLAGALAAHELGLVRRAGKGGGARWWYRPFLRAHLGRPELFGARCRDLRQSR